MNAEQKLKELLKFKKTEEGYYEKEIKGNIYSIRLNDESGEWHLYVNDEWSDSVKNCGTGKLTAVAKAMEVI